MTATPDAGVVNDYLIVQYATLIFGLLPPLLPAAVVRRGIGNLLCRQRRQRAKAGLCLLRGGAGAAIRCQVAQQR